MKPKNMTDEEHDAWLAACSDEEFDAEIRKGLDLLEKLFVIGRLLKKR